jgi:hypothetical protein
MMRPRIVLSLLLICVSTAACTSLLGDFTFGASQSDGGVAFEAGRVEGGSTGVGGQANVHAVAADVSVYLGQRATLDASKSVTNRGALTFAWRLNSAPPGSRLRGASLSGANTPTVSFGPDVVGQYALEITVFASGVSDTQVATVTAVVPQVLFAQGIDPSQAAGGAGRASAQYTIADLDGGNAHPVVCPRFFGNAWSEADLARLAPYAGRAFDYWEAPPGQPSKFAAFTVDYSMDAGFSTHLWAGTSASSCGAPPLDLGSAGFGPGRPYGSEPHFSPDGTRFVIFDTDWHIVTYSADEPLAHIQSAHVVASYPVPYDQAFSYLDTIGYDPGSRYIIEPPRATFTANGLAWAQPIAVGWEVVTAPDIPNAVPTTYMTCPGVTPREIAMLSDGTLIVSYRQTPSSSENLYQLKPDAQRRCTQEHQYTALSDSGTSIATDFEVSPDGTSIAFLELDTSFDDASTWTQGGGAQLPGGYVTVVPVAGGTPRRVSSDLALYGPRWIGGGTALVFTRLDGVPSSTGLPATSVVVIAPDGGAGHVVARGDGVSTFVATSGNAACDCAGVGLPNRWGIWGLGVVVVIGIAARRREET